MLNANASLRTGPLPRCAPLRPRHGPPSRLAGAVGDLGPARPAAALY
ncbi:hypothetical protein [Hymenobacter bucti]|uniref:Uncharacterized protein n=1 Tax=Hymenobacter bucti TaxID=1844114 RepID=A0ABW4R0I3_9BACT